MRRWMILGGAGLVAVASVAHGADKMGTGAVPAWVKPAALPVDKPAAADAKPDDAPVKVLLQDEQYDLQPGKQARYFETAYRIQSPQGLAAGTVNLTWNPDFETPVFHKLLIRRGDKVIDILAGGQTFTVVRRETNLESAMLDGELTATIQPEGLQVGDVLDFSATVTSADPALGRHIEQTGAAWNGLPVDHAHLRAQWPADLAVQLRSRGGIATPRPVKKGGMASIELSFDDLKPLVAPKGAPPRFQYGRLVEISDFASWTGLADLMAPLYAKASSLPADGPLQAEVAKIKAASADPKARAEAALALVQDRVRYVFLGMNDGGLVPADAGTTWSRRFGDCKGKTALLLGLLHALGITADPVVVSTTLGDGLDQRLPLVALFDHVLVRATIGGRAYWLDGTRSGDRHLDAIETPAFHWGLPIVPSAKLVAMMPAPYTNWQTDATMRIDASAGIGLPAPAHGERLVRGDEAVGMNIQLIGMAPDARDRGLREFWKSRYDFIDIKLVTSSFDPDKRELTLVMDGSAKMEWNDGWYEADRVWVGYRADFTRDAGADQNAPFAVEYPTSNRVAETILLPPGAGAFSVYHGEPVDKTVAGMAYKRRTELKGNVFTVVAEERSVAPEFPAAEASADQAVLRDLYKLTVNLRRNTAYMPTAAEMDLAMKDTPATADGFIARAGMLYRQKKLAEALADFDKAVTLEPANTAALTGRGGLYLMKGDRVSAKRDLDAALVADPHNATAWRARGMLAGEAGDLPGAIAAFTTSLASEPDNAFALSRRALAYHMTHQDALAAPDAAAAVKLRPDDVDLYLMLANIARARGDRATALAQADAVIAANPANGYALIVGARIHDTFGLHDQALREIDRAIALKPEAYMYVTRSQARPRADLAGRLADLDAALKLEPDQVDALIDKAEIQRTRHDYPGAITTLTAAHALRTGEPQLLVLRGIAHLHVGETALADKDFADAHALAKTAEALNGLCWEKTIAGVALQSALAECDAALVLSPDDSAIHDSRGLTLLRLARYDDAIAAYARSLATRPTAAGSLYGRALAEARKGDMAKADVDRQAALKADPAVSAEYAGYGLTMAGDAGAEGKMLAKTS